MFYKKHKHGMRVCTFQDYMKITTAFWWSLKAVAFSIRKRCVYRIFKEYRMPLKELFSKTWCRINCYYYVSALLFFLIASWYQVMLCN